MNSEATIGEDLRRLFKDILSVDVDLQESAIRALYDAECQLVNPYLVLHGRDEILASYRGQARSNLKISIDIYSVCVSILLCFALFIPHTGAVTAYDATKQIAMVDLHQTLTPKVSYWLV